MHPYRRCFVWSRFVSILGGCFLVLIPIKADMGKFSSMLEHPDEILPLLRMAQAAKQATRLPADPNEAFCFDMLNRVSRSFAVVIQQLPTELRTPICVFYLVLRALDTVEDDMAVPIATKVPVLKTFHEKITDRDFKMDCGQRHYNRLMQQYPTVTAVFLTLKPEYQKVIKEITRRMGAGMAKFIQREVETVADYDEYCHYVAGLVGVGLSQMFAASRLEVEAFRTKEAISNHMGLFLQKTNIIRDYLEDIMEEPAPRMFWPKEIWGQYAQSLRDLQRPENSAAAVRCLNHMITDALRHAPFCLEYMEQVQDRQNFRFCAIPQVMAIGTLAICYNNPKVFLGVVKMRRGQVALYMDSLHSMHSVFAAFRHFALIIEARCAKLTHGQAAGAEETLMRVKELQQRCQVGLVRTRPGHGSGGLLNSKLRIGVAMASLTYVSYAYLVHSSEGAEPGSLAGWQHRVLSFCMFLLVISVLWILRRRV